MVATCRVGPTAPISYHTLCSRPATPEPPLLSSCLTGGLASNRLQALALARARGHHGASREAGGKGCRLARLWWSYRLRVGLGVVAPAPCLRWVHVGRFLSIGGGHLRVQLASTPPQFLRAVTSLSSRPRGQVYFSPIPLHATSAFPQSVPTTLYVKSLDCHRA